MCGKIISLLLFTNIHVQQLYGSDEIIKRLDYNNRYMFVLFASDRRTGLTFIYTDQML